MSSPPERALFFLADLRGGGAQRTMLNLAAAMPPGRLAVEIALSDEAGAARGWLDPRLRVHALGTRRIAAAIPRLARRIRATRPHVVLSTMVDANIAAAIALRLSGVCAALALRETNSHRARADICGARRRLARWAYRRADLVVALAEGVRRELVEDMRLDPARTRAIPNPVNVAAIAAAAEAARRAPPPWHERWSGPTVVAIGRLHRQKGFDLLLAAFARHAPAEARLVILGEGDERAALEAQARALGLDGRLWLPGFAAAPERYLAHAAVFALSSRWEGFGHVIVEAMAAGAPVLATRCPYGPAEIIADHETGLLVPPEDADAFGAGLAAALADPARRQRLAQAARAAAARYESARVAEDYADALAAAAARRRALGARPAPAFGS
jgi:glycosyltransferase involved in cell wall biosynthesis